MGKPFGSALELKQLATPSGNPASGGQLLYFKSDGKLYTKTNAGVESLVTGASGSGITVTPQASPPSNPQVDDLWVAEDANPATYAKNFAVADANPGLTGPGMWVQTGLGDGTDFTIWIEDGL